MNHAPSPPSETTSAAKGSLLARYRGVPLYVKIMIGMGAGLVMGLLLKEFPKQLSPLTPDTFHPISDTVLRLLRLLATPLIFLAVARGLMRATVGAGAGAKLCYYLFSNTVAAICIGILVANVIQPGHHVKLGEHGAAPSNRPYSLTEDLLAKVVPKNFVQGWLENDVLSMVVIAVAVGIGLRRLIREDEALGKATCQSVTEAMDTWFRLVMLFLHWTFDLVPFAVFAVMTRAVGKAGLEPIKALAYFVAAVLVALALQGCFYVTRLWWATRMRPRHFLAGASDALTLSFSTASSAATLPVTYACATEKLEVSEENAGLAVMVGGTFNHDGTALYEAMTALFIAQAIGMALGLEQQLKLVLLSVVASVGAAGIPEAGLVTMIAVFTAVQLPPEYIPLVLPVDWFLDRCRTSINVMGDLSVACLLEGRKKLQPQEEIPGM